LTESGGGGGDAAAAKTAVRRVCAAKSAERRRTDPDRVVLPQLPELRLRLHVHGHTFLLSTRHHPPGQVQVDDHEVCLLRGPHVVSVIKRSRVRPSVRPSARPFARLSAPSINSSSSGERRVCCWVGRVQQMSIDDCCCRATCGPRKFWSDCKEVRHTC